MCMESDYGDRHGIFADRMRTSHAAWRSLNVTVDDRAVTSQDDGLRLPNDFASSKRPRRLETPIDLINSIEPPLQKPPSLAPDYLKFLGTHTIMSLVDSAPAPWASLTSSLLFSILFN